MRATQSQALGGVNMQDNRTHIAARLDTAHEPALNPQPTHPMRMCSCLSVVDPAWPGLMRVLDAQAAADYHHERSLAARVRRAALVMVVAVSKGLGADAAVGQQRDQGGGGGHAAWAAAAWQLCLLQLLQGGERLPSSDPRRPVTVRSAGGTQVHDGVCWAPQPHVIVESGHAVLGS